MQPALLKRWNRHAVLLLLGIAVIGVAAVSITESESTSGKPTPQPTNRKLTESSTPDLSLAGFRVGNLAVSLVGDLFLGIQFQAESPINGAASAGPTPSSETTRPVITISDTSSTSYISTTPLPPSVPTTTTVSTTHSPGTSDRQSSPSPTQTTAARFIGTTVVPTTTTTTTTTTPTTTAAPVSDGATKESFEPEQGTTAIVFGQPYSDTWPSLEMWERMAWCESRQTWDVDTGNGYFGGLQFALGSWQWMGGEGSPADASKEEQIYRANLLWQAQGWNGWPGCKQYFGWSRWQVRE